MRRRKRDVSIAGLRRKRATTPHPESEDAHQRAVAEYLDGLGVLWAHPPNGAFLKGGARAGAKLKAQGMKPGLPDVLIFERPRWPIQHDHDGVAIELKKPKAAGHTLSRLRRFSCSSVSAEQSAWLASLTIRGWSCWVCFGLDDVRDVMRWHGFDRSGTVRVEPQGVK